MTSASPLAERLAVVEAQVSAVSSAVVEIKDAVVGIRSTLEHVARLDERIITVIEAQREIRRSLEIEREKRLSGDATVSKRVESLEKTVPVSESKLHALGAWALRIGGGFVLIAGGYLLNSFGGG